MTATDVTDLVLWGLQWFLAAWFVGSTLVALPLIASGRLDIDRTPGFAELSRPTAAVIGVAHVAGGVGLVLPQLSGALPWLTPVSALALAVMCFMAGGYHLRAREDALEPSLWGLLCGAVFVGRADLLAHAPIVLQLAAPITTGVLFIALAINMVRLLRSPQSPLRSGTRARAPRS